MMKMDYYARYREIEPHWQRLEEHLLNVGGLSESFGKEIGLGNVLKFAGLLHDAGKGTDDWQMYLRESVNGKRKERKKDHASLGAKILVELLKNSRVKDGEDNNLEVLITALESVIMYHHGYGLPDFIGLDGTSQFKERLKKALSVEENDVLNRIPAEIKKELEFIINCDDLNKEIGILDGEEIISQIEDKDQKKHLMFEKGLYLRNMSSCLIDADRLDSAAFKESKQIDCFVSPQIPDWNGLLVILENYLKKISGSDELSNVRNSLSDSCSEFGKKEKGVYSCSAITGSGKTLASLRFALTQAKKHRMKHVFIIAPYTSVIDQNAEKIRKILETEQEKVKIVLEYHSNVVYESREEKEMDIVSWSYPIVITTMVQFLNSLFGAGAQKIRRMHQIANSVIIFDEIQTLPVKVIFMFNWALEYLVGKCGCSAMLCTATQPGLNMISCKGKEPYYDEYNLNITGEVVSDLRTHFSLLKRVVFIDKSEGGKKLFPTEGIAQYIKEQMLEINSFLAVVNTKKQAKELYDIVNTFFPEFTFHLSTDMCPVHRKRVIEELNKRLNNKEKTVCISTSLIEAGVDISFEGALRYLTGLDSIIQTAGRCNRNGKLSDENGNSKLGKVAIFNIQDENTERMEEFKKAKEATCRVLNEIQSENNILNLIDYDVIRSYFYYYYGSFEKTELSYLDKTGRFTILDLLSDNRIAKGEYKNKKKEKWIMPFCQSFKTAWESFEVIPDNTVGIISYYGEGKDIIGKLKSLDEYDESFYLKVSKILKEAQPYTINIYYNMFDKLKKNGIIYEIIENSGIYALEEGYYDSEKGLSEEIVSVTGLMVF